MEHCAPKKVVNIAIWELGPLGPVSNEISGNFTFYLGIYEFLNSPIIEKNNFLKEFYIVVSISQQILWNRNYITEFKKTVIFWKIQKNVKFSYFWTNKDFVVWISQNFLWNGNYTQCSPRVFNCQKIEIKRDIHVYLRIDMENAGLLSK